MALDRSATPSMITHLGLLQPQVDEALSQMGANKIVARIHGFDHTVWKQNPDGIVDRLGWLTIPQRMRGRLKEIDALVNELRHDGFTSALLMGMGGSSLAPEVFRKTFGVKSGYLYLAVVDSTDPRVVAEFSRRLEPAKTIYIVSTKSGGTVETLSFFKYFFNQVMATKEIAKPGDHFIAITDPGSRLEELGRSHDFRKIFLNDPKIGGRYSALSFFGLVPAALIGMDLPRLLNRAIQTSAPETAAGSRLGAVMGALALAGRNKLTLVISPAIAAMGSWIEQLVAESTGKEGRGILPVDGEQLQAGDGYGADRLFVYLRFKDDTTCDHGIEGLKKNGHPVVTIDISDRYDLGSEFFRWEMATVVAGHFLNINPFDQPNVESAKVSARHMLAAFEKEGRLPTLKPAITEDDLKVFTDVAGGSIETIFQGFMRSHHSQSHPYVAIQAYLQPSPQIDAKLLALRTQIQSHYRYATTVGYGPRFLHSTGQLHKGDGGQGLFIQLTDQAAMDIDIPASPDTADATITFGTLLAAQALGDRQALLDNGRQVIRFDLGRHVARGLNRLTGIVADLTS